ncbi:hypothetical protein E4U41_000474 [Claviceps citrina]|nr:hypothetical protein E4U41_000474 [Claviceps citrina]
MKFLLFATTALAASSSSRLAKRQVDVLKADIAAITTSVNDLQTVVENTQGVEQADSLFAGAQAVVDAIDKATTDAGNSPTLSSLAALDLTRPIQDLGSAVQSAIQALIGKKQVIVGTGRGCETEAPLQAQRSAAQAFIDTIATKLPANLAPVADELAQPIVGALEQGIAAFRGLQCAATTASAVPASATSVATTGAATAASTAADAATGSADATGIETATATDAGIATDTGSVVDTITESAVGTPVVLDTTTGSAEATATEIETAAESAEATETASDTATTGTATASATSTRTRTTAGPKTVFDTATAIVTETVPCDTETAGPTGGPGPHPSGGNAGKSQKSIPGPGPEGPRPCPSCPEPAHIVPMPASGNGGMPGKSIPGTGPERFGGPLGPQPAPLVPVPAGGEVGKPGKTVPGAGPGGPGGSDSGPGTLIAVQTVGRGGAGPEDSSPTPPTVTGGASQGRVCLGMALATIFGIMCAAAL